VDWATNRAAPKGKELHPNLFLRTRSILMPEDWHGLVWLLQVFDFRIRQLHMDGTFERYIVRAASSGWKD
jgi:hypothetical protein